MLGNDLRSDLDKRLAHGGGGHHCYQSCLYLHMFRSHRAGLIIHGRSILRVPEARHVIVTAETIA